MPPLWHGAWIEYFWEFVFVGCGVVFLWVWWRSGQTGIIKARGETFVREQQPFFFYTLRWFTFLLGLGIIAMIPFMSGPRALLGR